MTDIHDRLEQHIVSEERSFGRMESDINTLKNLTEANREDIKEILKTINKAQGGFRVGMFLAPVLGAIAGFFGSGIPK